MASACDGALRIRCSPVLAVADLASAADLAAEPAGLSTPPRGGCSSPSFSAFLPDDEAPRVPDSLPLAGAPPPRKSARSTACKGQTAQEEHGTPRGSWMCGGRRERDGWTGRQTMCTSSMCVRVTERECECVCLCVHACTRQLCSGLVDRPQAREKLALETGTRASRIAAVTKIWRDLL